MSRERTPLLGLNRRARVLLPIFMLLLLALTLRRLSAPEPDSLSELSGSTMGTTWAVKVRAPEASAGEISRLREAIRGRLDLIDSLMSSYHSESEISRFNRFASTEPFPLSQATLEVLALAQEVSELSGGAFDVTVGPLVSAWGFGVASTGASEAPPPAPTAGELASVRERVGYGLLDLELATGRISKAHPEVECDLSAIAKGYAVDQLVAALRDLGYRDFLVEVGGELAARGRRPDGTRWRVAIERPDALGRSIYAVVGLEDQAMATSGDYRNFYQRDGVRLSHLIDPRVGRPIAHRLASVSVVDPSAARADALATALSVLGPVDGPALAEREGIPAYFILRAEAGETENLATSGFAGLLLREPQSEQR